MILESVFLENCLNYDFRFIVYNRTGFLRLATEILNFATASPYRKKFSRTYFEFRRLSQIFLVPVQKIFS